MNCKRIIIMLLVSFLVSVSAYQARAAEGPQEILKRYVSELQRNPNDTALREKIIKHAQTMKPAPSIPEEARKSMSRGIAAIEGAKTESDFKEAIAEFEKVVKAAPWLGEGYRNLGIALDKAGLYDAAMKNLNFYLFTNPADAEKAKDLIYKIEYRKEKAQKEAASRRDEQERKRREEEARARGPQRLAGEWFVLYNGKWDDRQCLMKISGSSFELVIPQVPGIFGTIEGDSLSGSLREGAGNQCPDQYVPVRGRVTNGGSRIELWLERAASFKNCAVTTTKQFYIELFRK